MRAELDIPYTSLRSTVYCQSLPVPLLRQKPTTIGFRGNKRLTSRPNSNTNDAPKLWAFQRSDSGQVRSQRKPTATLQQTCTSYPIYTRLDENTMQWKSWTSYKEDCKNNNHDLSMYKITQDVFRKLTTQVKEANQRFNNFNGSGFKTYYTIGNKNVPIIKQAHSPSVSIATDFNPDRISNALITKPVVKSNKRRPHSTTALSRRRRIKVGIRPHSTTGTRVSRHQYSDCLTPDIIGALSEGEITGRDKEFPGPFDIVAHDSKPCESERFTDDSEVDEELRNLEEEDISEEEFLIKEDGLDGSLPKDVELSEEEKFQKMFEYDDEEEIIQRHQSLMAMKPEEINEDEVMMFDYRGFSAPYKPQEEFSEALSDPFCHMDLLELSLLDKDWRSVVRQMPEGNELGIIQRLIKMERTQFDTKKWERKECAPSKRATSVLQERKGWNGDAALPTERARSALAQPKANKNCEDSCVEVLCAGDCPSKRRTNTKACLHCRQRYCDGSCTEYGYYLYVRQPKEDKEEIQSPKSCKTCRRSSKMNTINSNQMIMGRPKSAFATFTSTKHQSAKPKPMKLSDTPGSERVRSAMSMLGLKEPSRPKTGKKQTRARGRNAMIPGKSYQSQRRNSLTDEPLTTSAARMNPKGLIHKKKTRPKSVK